MTYSLSTIISVKKKEVMVFKRDNHLLTNRHPSRNVLFRNAIENPKNRRVGLISEIKMKSPSKGVLGNRRGIEAKIGEYMTIEVDAISVVVDHDFFGGDYSFIKRVKKVSPLPVLCKDFVIDEVQIKKAKQSGADAVLIIAKIISSKLLKRFVDFAISFGIEPVVEINTLRELNRALETEAYCIAVNARNLNSLKVDIQKACNIGRHIPPDRMFLAFSGVTSAFEVKAYREAGARAILIGTHLMQSNTISKSLKELSL